VATVETVAAAVTVAAVETATHAGKLTVN